MTFRECVLKALLEVSTHGELAKLRAFAALACEHWSDTERQAWHPFVLAIRDGITCSADRAADGRYRQSGTETAAGRISEGK